MSYLSLTDADQEAMLERGIGMGYVAGELVQPGTNLTIDIRGRARRGRVVKKPIYSREER